jgi:4-methyl-5(b-hydroxyethyl)-thiazole monophosphate biosynthesis
MKAYVLIYDGFALFESVILGYLLNTKKHQIVTVSTDKRVITSVEGFHLAADALLNEIELDEVDLFVVPGGDSYTMLGNPDLIRLLQTLDRKNMLIGSICHGPALLAEAGLLRGRRFVTNATEQEPEYHLFHQGTNTGRDVEEDRNIITAKGNAYVEFAFAVCDRIGLFATAEERDACYQFFANNRHGAR